MRSTIPERTHLHIAVTQMLEPSSERGRIMESFYLVWNPTGRIPVLRHPTVDSARAEARRLAELHKNDEFFVLRAVESVRYRTDPFVCKNYRK